MQGFFGSYKSCSINLSLGTSCDYFFLSQKLTNFYIYTYIYIYIQILPDYSRLIWESLESFFFLLDNQFFFLLHFIFYFEYLVLVEGLATLSVSLLLILGVKQVFYFYYFYKNSLISLTMFLNCLKGKRCKH